MTDFVKVKGLICICRFFFEFFGAMQHMETGKRLWKRSFEGRFENLLSVHGDKLVNR